MQSFLLWAETPSCWLYWCVVSQANGIWGQLTALKKVVSEPKGTGEAFDAVMKEYYGAVRKGQGGLFMAVCRGKVLRSTPLLPLSQEPLLSSKRLKPIVHNQLLGSPIVCNDHLGFGTEHSAILFTMTCNSWKGPKLSRIACGPCACAVIFMSACSGMLLQHRQQMMYNSHYCHCFQH